MGPFRPLTPARGQKIPPQKSGPSSEPRLLLVQRGFSSSYPLSLGSHRTPCLGSLRRVRGASIPTRVSIK